MAVELDVFVGNTTIMDEEVYQLWLDGYTGISGGDYIRLLPCSVCRQCSYIQLSRGVLIEPWVIRLDLTNFPRNVY